MKARIEKLKVKEYNHCSNFYDWFCTDKGLAGRAKRLETKLAKVLKAN